MNRDKRNQLVLVLLSTLGVLAGLWFGLLTFQQQGLRRLKDQKSAAEFKVDQMQFRIKNADKIQAELGETTQKLGALESEMASGDLYAWMINTIRKFKLPYKVEIPQYSQIDGPRDTTLLPGFPYKQATITVAGTAHFHDLGRFLADFENEFPHIRVVNLNMELNPGATGEDAETLSFRMDIVTLVKSNAS